MATTSPASRLDSLLYTAGELAAVLNCSERFVWKKHAAGELPAPLRIGKLVRWPKALIATWIIDGCPKPPRARR